jgi:uncharacterized protein YcfJ
MTDTNNNEMSIILNGKDTIEIVNQLCTTTGMTPSCLIALLVRKYGADLESWLGYSISPLKEEKKPTKVELPTDPGKHLPPVEL